MKAKWLNLLLLACFALPVAELRAESETKAINSDDSENLQHRVEQKRFRFLLGFEVGQIKKDADRTIAYGGQGMFLISLSRRFQVGFGMRQTFNSRAVSVVYSTLDMRLDYALTGSLLLEKSSSSIAGKEVLASSINNNGGLRAYAALSQYFLKLNAVESQNSSVGLGVYYDFPSESTINYYLGARVDRINLGSSPVYPAQLYFGLSFWL